MPPWPHAGRRAAAAGAARRGGVDAQRPAGHQGPRCGRRSRRGSGGSGGGSAVYFFSDWGCCFNSDRKGAGVCVHVVMTTGESGSHTFRVASFCHLGACVCFVVELCLSGRLVVFFFAPPEGFISGTLVRQDSWLCLGHELSPKSKAGPARWSPKPGPHLPAKKGCGLWAITRSPSPGVSRFALRHGCRRQLWRRPRPYSSARLRHTYIYI